MACPLLYAAAVRGRIAAGPNAGDRVATFGGDRIDVDSLDAMKSPRCAAVEADNPTNKNHFLGKGCLLLVPLER